LLPFYYTISFSFVAGVLEPKGHYNYNFGKDLARVKALTSALKKMAPPEEFVQLIPQIEMYINLRGSYGGIYPDQASDQVTATQWWITFGDSTPLLQKYALRIVSQCTSSSACERNWSLFALVHTQVRNRLGFERLHKLVFCHHNLGMRIREILDEAREKEVDPCAVLMDVSLYDSENPIMDWLANPSSEPTPSNDEHNDEHNDEYNDEYNDYGDASPCPTVLEVHQTKRRRHGNHEEYEEEEAEGEEVEEDDELNGDEEDEETDNNDELPSDENQPLRRKSTRKKKKSLKLLSALKAKGGNFYSTTHLFIASCCLMMRFMMLDFIASI
jgi:hypothetical protein